MPDYQAGEAPLSYPGPDNESSLAKRGRETLEDDDYDD